MKIASLRLPDEIFQRLDRLADRTGRSKTFYIQAAIQEHLDDLEGLVPCRATADRYSSREVSDRATRRSHGTLWPGRSSLTAGAVRELGKLDQQTARRNPCLSA